MKAIIIAAGSGKRIGKDVKDLPKSLVPINGKPILEYQISALNQVGITEILVIVGPYSEKFSLNSVSYLKDNKYAEHDILGSLMEAKDHLKGDVLVLYSDIIFDKQIIQQTLNSSGDISIAIDLDWEKKYVGRTEHPPSEAENVLLDENNQILQIRKNIQEQNTGEFLGIVKFSANGSKIFVKKFEKMINLNSGTFHTAPSISKAYLTDALQEIIDSKIFVEPIFISGKWCEIDTLQDLKNAEKLF